MINKYSYLLPITASPELAGIVADLIGDGHLQGEPKWRFDYCSKSIKELERFGMEVYKLFGVKGKIRPCTTNKLGKSFLYGVNCKPLARALYICGVPEGEKVTQKFDIPEWIIEDREYFGQFVSRLYCCEGTVDYGAPSIDLEMYKIKNLLPDGIRFFEQLRSNLESHFDVHCTKVFIGSKISRRKDGRDSIGIRIKIKRKADVKRWVEVINYPFDPSKKERILNKLEEKPLNKITFFQNQDG